MLFLFFHLIFIHRFSITRTVQNIGHDWVFLATNFSFIQLSCLYFSFVFNTVFTIWHQLSGLNEYVKVISACPIVLKISSMEECQVYFEPPSIVCNKTKYNWTGCVRIISSSQSKNAVHVFLIYANYSLSPWKIPEEISRRSMLFNNWRQYCNISNMSKHFYRILSLAQAFCF